MAYAAWTGFGNGVFHVFEEETPLEDADPAMLATWEHEYPDTGLVAVA